MKNNTDPIRSVSATRWLAPGNCLEFMDKLPLGIISCTRGGTIVYGNLAALDLFKREVVGLSAGALLQFPAGGIDEQWEDISQRVSSKDDSSSGLIPVLVTPTNPPPREIMCKFAFDSDTDCFTCVFLPGVHGMLAGLARIAESAIHAYHIDATLRTITCEARKLTPAARCYIAYHVADGKSEVRALCSRDTGVTLATTTLPSKAGLISIATRTGTLERSRNLPAEPLERRYSPFADTLSQIVVPLVSAERSSTDRPPENVVHGVLIAESDQQLGPDAENVLQTIALHGAIAIAHARLLNEVSSTYDDILQELRSGPETSLVRELIHDAKNLVRDASETVENIQSELSESAFGKRRAAELAASIYSLNDIRDLLGEMLKRFKLPTQTTAAAWAQTQDLTPITKQVQRILRGTAAGQVEIALSNENRRQYLVYAERSKVVMLLYNLMANSVNAIKTSGRPGKLTVSLSDVPKQRNARRIEISDTGPGMPRGVKALIRGGESVTRTAGGSGIGLLTVREIVKDLKGSISMDSRLGEGTKVILDLPGPETTEK